MGKRRLKQFKYIHSKGNIFWGNVSLIKLTTDMTPLAYTEKTKLRTRNKPQTVSYLVRIKGQSIKMLIFKGHLHINDNYIYVCVCVCVYTFFLTASLLINNKETKKTRQHMQIATCFCFSDWILLELSYHNIDGFLNSQIFFFFAFRFCYRHYNITKWGKWDPVQQATSLVSNISKYFISAIINLSQDWKWKCDFKSKARKDSHVK